eukprot:CAMPEP_0113435130 /NCGR_PEP_ID=MMETSP0013_2-20120614/36082_1 /TAXON_ID=2843 ORGANISM="Skeletonema costatum, Strain 1716" /NCGR_SAMPLE_ID=MMETSP0013_2 /ASSEMBLY_ACC=CAM_ASM_000158 /LENGTH=40 /DNA_ID=CAMNT_0000325425 /DNA_START=60 /DNA_END=179 /DNA_ORIENTATION=+ /assembly_acc=CAM_ASM_000158
MDLDSTTGRESRFMFGLPKREMGCDVTEWTWTQKQGENGP